MNNDIAIQKLRSLLITIYYNAQPNFKFVGKLSDFLDDFDNAVFFLTHDLADLADLRAITDRHVVLRAYYSKSANDYGISAYITPTN